MMNEDLTAKAAKLLRKERKEVFKDTCYKRPERD